MITPLTDKAQRPIKRRPFAATHYTSAMHKRAPDEVRLSAAFDICKNICWTILISDERNSKSNASKPKQPDVVQNRELLNYFNGAVIIGKLTVADPVKKFPAFHRNQKITMIRHWNMPRAS